MSSKLSALVCSILLAWGGHPPAIGAEKGGTPFAVGQKWFYTFEGKEAPTPLKIVGAGVHPKAGAGFDVEVTFPPQPGGFTTPFTIIRVSTDALERSVTRQVEGIFPVNSSFLMPPWDSGIGMFGKSVECAIVTTREGIEASQKRPCEFDRDKMLALDQNAFDQDMNGGWRTLDNSPKCQAIAADLIRDYRTHHKNEASILYWHEGQMRAGVGQKLEAIALFERSRHITDNGSGWNQYVDASIAFLRGDRTAFDAARNELAALPKPAGYDLKLPDGREVPWPMNLEVVDGLGKCFDKPYNEAYGACRN